MEDPNNEPLTIVQTVEDPSEAFDPSSTPGWHVTSDSVFLGTFIDEEQAQFYIDGQLKPQGIVGTIVKEG